MIRVSILLGVIFISATSCRKQTKTENDFSINLNLVGFADGTQFKLLNLDEEEFVDSVRIYNNKLSFTGSVKEPFDARIHTVDNKYLILWIEKGDIEVKGDFENFGSSTIKGTPLNDVYVKYRDRQKMLFKTRDSLTQLMIKAMSSDSKHAEEEFKRLNQQIEIVYRDMFDIRIGSISSEQPSIYTMRELYFLRNDLKKDSLALLFNRFPEEYQTTKYGQVIHTYISNESVKVGDRYIDINGDDREGVNIKLSKLNGKYVLLNFWASWCGPCRQENPVLVKLYNKYHEKGFEIFSFSTDVNLKSWEKASENDSITWINVVDKKGSYSNMSALYNVRAIPSSFLINPQGIIIAKNLSGEALENKLIDELK